MTEIGFSHGSECIRGVAILGACEKAPDVVLEEWREGGWEVFGACEKAPDVVLEEWREGGWEVFGEGVEVSCPERKISVY